MTDEELETMIDINARLEKIEVEVYEFTKSVNRLKIFGVGYYVSMERLSGRCKD